MKNIIKTAFCLIVISSILLYSSVSHAANPATIENTPPYSFYLFLDETYNPQVDSSDDPLGGYNIYKYTCSFPIGIIIRSVDGYLNGRFSFLAYATITAPTNYTSYGYDRIVENNITDYYFTSTSIYTNQNPMQVNSASFKFDVIFNNFWCDQAQNIQVCYLTVNFYLHVPTTASNAYMPETRISGNLGFSLPTNKTEFSALPVTGQNFGLILKQAITDALHDGELDLVYDYLTFWKTTQDGYLADIVLSTDDVETWLSYINSAQASLQNKVDLIYVLEQTFPGYFNSMISILQQIRDMNSSDTAAESQMQNAEQQLSQAVNDMEVQKPNINNVVNAGDQYMDSNITGAQSDTFFWLHGNNMLVTILVMSVTIGILGFVIYGKSG